MSTALFSHDDFILHNPGDSHPESPDRLRAINQKLCKEDFDSLVRKKPEKADIDVIKLVHTEPYIRSILKKILSDGIVALDSDTYLSKHSGDAALRAVGSVCEAIDLVLDREVVNAFCAIRPPGHHAGVDQAGGFCLFNNVAIGARYAQVVRSLIKVAVVDFDVHHGNGTQHIFEKDRSLFYCSTHQHPAYPGTGLPSETGVGNILNVPLAPGSGSAEFRLAYNKRIFPSLKDFNPDIILISAGFDAHVLDPLCQLRLNDEDFEWVTRGILKVAHDCCDSRVVSVLEGGYNLDALSSSVAHHIKALLNSES